MSIVSLNEYREKFRQYAKDIVHTKPTIYSLVLPTGGGKTLTSLSLAANISNGNMNCIYVCPRNSILEQTKNIYQTIFGRENTLAHYGYPEFIIDKEERNFRKMDTLMWNSPIILTSYVQFFESLFHNKVPKLIKFSALYGRTIIIDEIQLMPLEMLDPTLKALLYLVDELHCSIILMSATSPDFSKTKLKDRKIETIGTVEDIESFCSLANNIDIQLLEVEDDSVFENCISKAKEINANSILYVANTIEQAKKVFDRFKYSCPEYKTLCLTTNVVTNHRRKILSETQRLLNKKKKIILVSTSIVEAGVDFDFDIGFREMTNYNSVVQVAGRVKRNRRHERGNLYVVYCPNKDIIPKCFASKSSEIQITFKFLKNKDMNVEGYNKEVAKQIDYDKNKVIKDMNNPQTDYPEITKKMRIISSPTTQLYLKDYDAVSKRLFEKAIKDEPFNIAKYMEYVVNVYNVDKFECTKYLVGEDPKREIYVYEGDYDLEKGIVQC